MQILSFLQNFFRQPIQEILGFMIFLGIFIGANYYMSPLWSLLVSFIGFLFWNRFISPIFYSLLYKARLSTHYSSRSALEDFLLDTSLLTSWVRCVMKDGSTLICNSKAITDFKKLPYSWIHQAEDGIMMYVTHFQENEFAELQEKQFDVGEGAFMLTYIKADSIQRVESVIYKKS